MCDHQYNGWTNHETWQLALWFGDTLAEYDGDKTEKGWARTLIETFLYECSNAPTSGYIGDVISSTLSQIDWYEIEENFCDSIEDSEEEA